MAESADERRLARVIRLWVSDIYWFSKEVIREPLRRYQLEPARAIVKSVLRREGREFAVLFPRQSGKNLIQAHMTAYLLTLAQHKVGAQIVQVSPTFRPQGQNAMRRLEQSLTNGWTGGRWRRRDGYALRLGHATALFLSADPAANVVGATANLMLLVDEAQHVPESLFYERFAPMAASTNATIAYFGTAWTARTLLARAIQQLQAEEAGDGVRRVFIVSPETVAAENPDYGQHVRRQVARWGRMHPLIRSQYFNETIDSDGGMFPPERRALMQGAHAPLLGPRAGQMYALLLDVGGEDESASGETANPQLQNPKRDSTALTVVEVGSESLTDPVLMAPTYRVVHRREWIGVKHMTLYGGLAALAKHWRARYLVADATGIGAGLVSFLRAALGQEVVVPFQFNRMAKSGLGWDFLAVCDTGRFKDYAPGVRHLAPGGVAGVNGEAAQFDGLASKFFRQLEFVQYAIAPGPAKPMRWGVPDGTRDPATGELVHDDLVVSAALAAALDQLEWASASPTLMVPGTDPLAGQERQF